METDAASRGGLGIRVVCRPVFCPYGEQHIERMRIGEGDLGERRIEGGRWKI